MDGAADDMYWRVQETQRSIELLRAWLTPDQLRQFDEHGWFIVRGDETGKRYRINYADASYNVQELNNDGLAVACFCIVPEGNLPVGDVMLVQKMAFELDELAARRIANRRVMF
jgi:hypothetical protein